MEEATYDSGHVRRAFVKMNGCDSVGGDDGSFEGEDDGYSVMVSFVSSSSSSSNVPVVSFKFFSSLLLLVDNITLD